MYGSGDDLHAPRRVGLALGSGSARGWAHIGVIRALTEAGIDVECVAGTSMGAMVGAALVLNKIDVLEGFARQLDRRQIVSFMDLTFPTSGLLDGKDIIDLFRGHVHATRIEDLPVPYCAIATDLSTGREVVLRAGDLVEAIRASISVPGVFAPVKKDGSFLVDGGLVNPVPVSAVRSMGADCVIAVDLNSDIVETRALIGSAAIDSTTESLEQPVAIQDGNVAQALSRKLKALGSPTLSHMRLRRRWEPVPSIFGVLTTAINIMEAHITAANLMTSAPDLLIQPQLGRIRFLEFHRADEAIAEGYRETMAQLRKRGWLEDAV
ncbi:MAG TPA: patatin-like phospholipase family protein [Thermoanaerobaculia bacterium]|jgi:NTE family protein|nr:patatin-like phospholipase family protein [Thermoanaerobaculia bacterium]HQP88537.1 patatin-like phospholipase family protein [Thermoanaerobaculia bacterium]